MKFLLFLLFGFILCPVAAFSQEMTPVSRYLADSESIFVVKCLSIGPVNILGNSRVEAGVLHAIKGEKPTKLSFSGRVRMTPGDYYLVRFARTDAEKSGSPGDRTSVVPIASVDEALGLDKFSPEIAVLRTMNLRIFRLESELQSIAYELENMKKVTVPK